MGRIRQAVSALLTSSPQLQIAIARLAVFDAEFSLPVIVEDVAVVTVLVVTMNVAVEAPTAMETVAGSFAEAEDEVRATLIAPLPAGTALRVTVAVDDAPPTTEAGESVKPVIWNGLTVSTIV